MCLSAANFSPRMVFAGIATRLQCSLTDLYTTSIVTCSASLFVPHLLGTRTYCLGAYYTWSPVLGYLIAAADGPLLVGSSFSISSLAAMATSDGETRSMHASQ